MIKNSQDKTPYRHTFNFGSEQIECHIIFDERERLKIAVHPDQRVIVNAPLSKSLPQILDKVKKRAAWIVKQLYYFEQFMPRIPERKCLSGESFYYLGRQYRLKVIADEAETVKLIGRFLRVHTSDKTNTKRVKQLLDKWYRQHAVQTFYRRLDLCYDFAKRYGIIRPSVKVRLMRRRWGSCDGSDSILLNTHLVKAPLRCVDYVIIHELCHLKFPTHSDSFYRLLSRLMPDWKERKERLEHVTL